MDHVTGSTITNYIVDDMASIVGGNFCLPFYFCSCPPPLFEIVRKISKRNIEAG